MSVEMKLLGWSVALGLTYVLVAAGLATAQRGLKWNAGNREEAKPLTGAAARAVRASANYLETFPFFAAAVLAVSVAQASTPHTVLGEEIYLGARVLYLPVYLIGIPYLRTVIWTVAFWGMLQVLEGLF